MKKILLVGLLFYLGVKSYSQDYTQLRLISDEIFKLGLSPYEVKNYSEIEGSPYLYPDLMDGKIITKTDKVLVGKLRYNIYTDEIEFQYKNSMMSFAQPDNFKEFYIDSQKILYCTYHDGAKAKNGFMLVVADGDYSLLVKKSVIYIAKEKPQPYTFPKPDRFETKDDTYYLSYQNQNPVKIVSSKKLVKSFPELDALIRNYPEKNVNYGKQDDLKRLVEYINSQSK